MLEYFDTDVVKRLNMQRETTAQKLGDYQHMMMRLARAELTSAQFTEDRFLYKNEWYDLNWPQAEENDARFFRPHVGLGKSLISQAKEHDLSTTALLELDYRKLRGKFADVASYLGQSGELIVEKYTIETSRQKQEYLLVSACLDNGKILALWVPANGK